VLIPSDGSVISGYTTIINKWAKNPNAAKLAREYILSDAGQINLAKGNARPIRAEHLTLPADVQAKLLPNEQYAKVKPIENAAEAWEATSKALPQQWQENVIIEWSELTTIWPRPWADAHPTGPIRLLRLQQERLMRKAILVVLDGLSYQVARARAGASAGLLPWPDAARCTSCDCELPALSRPLYEAS
jgi:hypothetical protein